MTLRRPEEQTLPQWIFAGMNFKTIVATLVMVIGAHYALGTRVTVVEQKNTENAHSFEEVTKRMDLQMGAINHLRDTKVDKDTYDGDQKRIADELSAIQLSVGRIEQILMEPKNR